MCGSGNLEVMRLVKKLRVRITTPEVTYGSYMAIHMSLGLLFLGGGRYVVYTLTQLSYCIFRIIKVNILNTICYLMCTFDKVSTKVILGHHVFVVLLYICRYSLSTGNKAVATMLCSFYPKFPSTSVDNRLVMLLKYVVLLVVCMYQM